MGGIEMTIDELLCLFAYIDCPPLLSPLESWSQPQIKYEVKSVGVALHRIITDLDSGYWKVKFSEASWIKLTFWGVNKKLTWTKMRMGALNASPVFGATMSAPQQERQKEAEHQNIRYCGLEVIVYDIVLFKILPEIILLYFEVVLYTPHQYFSTIKICKCMFLVPHQELIGVDICNELNA